MPDIENGMLDSRDLTIISAFPDGLIPALGCFQSDPTGFDGCGPGGERYVVEIATRQRMPHWWHMRLVTLGGVSERDFKEG